MKKYEIEKETEGESIAIVLIGPTGVGKSTFANVLVNKNDNFEEIFKESGLAASETKGYQIESFKIGNKTYEVVDIIGLGDTELDPEIVKLEIVGTLMSLEKTQKIKFFFITKNRITNEYKEAFNFLIKVFGKEVVKHITLVRTGFSGFRNENTIEKDFQSLITDSKNKFSSSIVEKIGGRERIIWVDNPPVPGEVDFSNKGEKEFNKKEIERAKEIRRVSREKSLNYLLNQKGEDYLIGDIDLIKQLIASSEEKIGEKYKEMQDLLKKFDERIAVTQTLVHQSNKNWNK